MSSRMACIPHALSLQHIPQRQLPHSCACFLFGAAQHVLPPTRRRSGDVRENGGGGGGGFSFPVTPPSDPEPDQRLFTSWPSVRSSCTSEPIAIDDDDAALPAEYADHGGKGACHTVEGSAPPQPGHVG